jgi:hypothetical protein
MQSDLKADLYSLNYEGKSPTNVLSWKQDPKKKQHWGTEMVVTSFSELDSSQELARWLSAQESNYHQDLKV